MLLCRKFLKNIEFDLKSLFEVMKILRRYKVRKLLQIFLQKSLIWIVTKSNMSITLKEIKLQQFSWLWNRES